MSISRRLNLKSIALITVWSSLVPNPLSATACELLRIEQNGKDHNAVLVYSSPEEVRHKRISLGPRIEGARIKRSLRTQQICNRLPTSTVTHTLQSGKAYPLLSLEVYDDNTQSNQALQALTRWDSAKDVESVWNSAEGKWLLRSVLDSSPAGVVDIETIVPQAVTPPTLPSAPPQASQLLAKGQYNYHWNGIELRRIIAATQTIHDVQQSVYKDCVIPDHDGREVVFVKPFEVTGYAMINNKVGGHDISGAPVYQHHTSVNVTDKAYVYYENGKFYHVKVTKEILKRDPGTGEHQVGFLVFSRLEHERLDTLPEAYHWIDTTKTDNRFEEGVYELRSVKRHKSNQIRPNDIDEEEWLNLRTDKTVKVGVPTGVSSFPGLSYSPYRQDEAKLKGLDIEERVSLGSKLITDHYATPAHQNKPSVLFIGRIGSGKTTITHLAMDALECIEDEGEGDVLTPSVGQSLPGIEIKANGLFESTELPTFFPDITNPINIIDFPGFGDGGGTNYDIANAKIMNELLREACKQGQTKIALVVTLELMKAERSSGFLKLLNALGDLAPDGDISTLEQGLVLVINKYNSKVKFGGVLCKKILDEQANPEYREDSRSILLNANAERILKHLEANATGRVLTIREADPETWETEQPKLKAAIQNF